jgi:hypothetical protein
MHDQLPLRWTVILLAAIGLGVAIGLLSGPAFGIAGGLSAVGVLHQIIGK